MPWTASGEFAAISTASRCAAVKAWGASGKTSFTSPISLARAAVMSLPVRASSAM